MPDVSSPDHLPKRRPDGKPPADPTSYWPRQRRGTTPQMIGRYPDYDVLTVTDTWDEATKRVVLARLEPRDGLRFFTAEEEPTLRAFCDTVMAQDREPKVPVSEFVDDKLAAGKLDGYQYADLPDDGGTWRVLLRGLDFTTWERHGRAFAECDDGQRDAVIDDLAGDNLSGGPWDSINVSHAWKVVMRSVLQGFYSHPWAWNEIGFGGPAYPRGFMRMGPTSTLEPFETPGASNEDPVPVAQQLEDTRRGQEQR